MANSNCCSSQPTLTLILFLNATSALSLRSTLSLQLVACHSVFKFCWIKINMDELSRIAVTSNQHTSN
ncbi:Uncharacterized protein APZ42_027064 [Daphnia magna]|uniref:Uncharacterized protein n=1 Tax=Daphnia magna TaxID=35525 RepID=A0A164RPN4_9CRUS|nr:Uncharacterized protein APZ42_027064 [Daphnia magna]